jgi:phosphoribosylformylglycinamidine synthase
VIYVGAKTGRDGIHGATMASAGFGEDAGAKRPNVQIGDPFMEKLLLEACLEAMQKGLIVGIQDMGAAGLTSSSCEMGARAGTGVEMELDLVPQREDAMTAYEIMLSESQERMLLVAEKAKEKEIFEVFHKWGLDAVTVGHVTSDGLLRIKLRGTVMAEIPNKALADEGPKYERPMLPPTESAPGRFDLFSFLDGCEESIVQEFLAADQNPATANFNHLLLLAAGSPNLCSREWVWEQYDHMVQSNTVVAPGSDAAVIRVKGTSKALVMKLDGPGYRVARFPREGAKMMVAEAARNIACTGGRPLAATNCLNFGNPEHPEVMWQFSEVVDGMSEACSAFETPITGGNVSFYNETLGGDIYPTPVLGMVGLIENLAHVTTSHFKDAGDSIVLVETQQRDPNKINLDDERALQNMVREAIQSGLVKSAHDISEGGLAVSIAECCYSSTGRPSIGAAIKIPSQLEACKDLFGEYPSRILLTTQKASELIARAGQTGLRGIEIGSVGGNRLVLEYQGRRAVDLAMDELETVWRRAFPKLLS